MGDSAFNEILASLRAFGDSEKVARLVAAKAEKTLAASLEKSLAAGTSPEGKPWAPREKGGRAYQAAASRVAVKSYGNLVSAVLSGPEVYGHFGAHGMPERKMLPDAGAGLPKSVSDALILAATQVFDELVESKSK
jgi:hypothetical protein